MLLEATLEMIGSSAAWACLPVGTNVQHALRGPGVITAILPDGQRELTFPSDRGGTHKYRSDSMFKLGFSIEDCTQEQKRDTHALLLRALMLCVSWEMPVLVGTAIANTRHIPADGAGSLPAVRAALQRALELQRIGVATELLKLPGSCLKGIDMCQLYSTHNSSLARTIYAQLHPPSLVQLTAFARLSSTRELTSWQEYRAYQNIVGPLLKGVLEPIQKMVLAS